MTPQMDDAGGAMPARLPTAIPVAAIDDTGRLRPVDLDKMEQVRRSMAAIGLRNAIEVRAKPGGGWRLVAGAHRLAAARALGWATIDAVVFEGSDDEARLAEIDENLVRHELSPFDQAVFLAERAAIYRRLNPETRRGGDSKSKKIKDKAPNSQPASLVARAFAQDVAERIGFHPSTVWRALARFERLTAEARALVRGSAIAANGAALDALIKAPLARQAAVARHALGLPGDRPITERMATAREAVLGVVRPAPDRVRAVQAAFERLSVPEREAFVAWLRETGQIGRRGAGAAA